MLSVLVDISMIIFNSLIRVICDFLIGTIYITLVVLAILVTIYIISLIRKDIKYKLKNHIL